MKTLHLPLKAETVNALCVGDPVTVSGIVVTVRDRAHKWLYETCISSRVQPSGEDMAIHRKLRSLLQEGAVYHCGPIVRKVSGDWQIVAAGPTTSEREEPYEAALMKHFTIRLIIGKGGMGESTRQACREVPAVYLTAVGGAAVIAAARIKRVVTVYKMEFGIPEALWVMEMADFPAIVTMDAWGNSLHEDVKEHSHEMLRRLLSR